MEPPKRHEIKKTILLISYASLTINPKAFMHLIELMTPSDAFPTSPKKIEPPLTYELIMWQLHIYPKQPHVRFQSVMTFWSLDPASLTSECLLFNSGDSLSGFCICVIHPALQACFDTSFKNIHGQKPL